VVRPRADDAHLEAIVRVPPGKAVNAVKLPSEKHFCAWLNVAPNNRISGGKILSSKPRKNANRAAAALRLAAQSAMQSKTAVGAFIRRIKVRLGAPTAINAGAHKLARLLYRMLKFGKAYIETGQEAYEGYDPGFPARQTSPRTEATRWT
jgi:transposase